MTFYRLFHLILTNLTGRAKLKRELEDRLCSNHNSPSCHTGKAIEKIS